MTDQPSRGPLEKWGAKAVALTAIISLVFLVFPRLKPEPEPSPERGASSVLPSTLVVRQETPPATLASPSVEQPGDVILGTWRQYWYGPAGDLQWLSTYVVSKVGTGYAMTALELVEAEGVTPSLGVFDVRADGYEWEFSSNWGQGRVGYFVLYRVSPSRFEGDVMEGGRVVGRNRWVKVP